MAGKRNNSNRRRRIAVIDVGHGNCAVLCLEDTTIVVDTGVRGALLQFLTNEKTTQINAVYLSHADKDHIGGLVQLLASRVAAISAVYLNTDSAKPSAAWDDLVYELDHRDAAGELKFRTSLTPDDSADYDNGRVRLQIVSPSKYLAARGPGSTDQNGNKITSNSISAVIRILADKQPVLLLTGDVDQVGLDDIERHLHDLRVATMVFPHHGGLPGAGDLTTLARRLYVMAAPSTVIFSVGRGRNQHPRPELVRQIRDEWKGCRIACTQLTTHCAARLPDSEPTHLNREFAAGRRRRRCCAGTLIIDLDSVDSLLPTKPAHQDFITSYAPTALCRAEREPVRNREKPVEQVVPVARPPEHGS